MIAFPAGAKVWIAGGVTDMRCGMNGLALKIQQGLGRDPHSGEIFCFRGRKADMVKLLWFDGIGTSLYPDVLAGVRGDENRVRRIRMRCAHKGVWPDGFACCFQFGASASARASKAMIWRLPRMAWTLAKSFGNPFRAQPFRAGSAQSRI